MANRSKLSPEQIQEAIREVARGTTTIRDAAARFGVSEQGLGQAMRRAERKRKMARGPKKPTAQKSKPVDAPSESASEPPAASDDVDTIAGQEDMDPAEQRRMLTALIRWQDEQIKHLDSIGEIAEARKLTTEHLKAQAVLARINKKLDADHITMSRAELAKRAAAVRERVLGAVAKSGRPLLCAHCNRKLSVKWAGAEEGEK